MDEHSNTSETTLTTFSHNHQSDTECGDSTLNGSEPNLIPKMPEGPEPELIFDSGLKAWLQVLGGFFLFFNSWYVLLAEIHRSCA